jgi:CheY-like chemotaxis protein
MKDNRSAGYMLYADDDREDQEFLRELLNESDPDIHLVIKDSGEDILQFLNGLPAESNPPGLIILDLNMPCWDGIQTLNIIRQNERFRNLPVLIFSTAINDEDRERAFSSGAVAFVRKPSRYNELKTIIESFADFVRKKKPADLRAF